MLEHEETISLIERAQKGDEDARTKLIEHNMPLIKSIIKRYSGRPVEYDDLMQLGAMGLVKAINNFDVSFGVRFSTYAVPMITGEIKRFLRDDGSIKVSRALKMLSQRIREYVDDYKNKNGGEPTVEMIAEALSVEPTEAVFAMDSARFPLSLTPADNDEPSLIDKIIYTDDDFIDKMQLMEIINELPDREKKIIMLRYFRDKTQGEVAEALGVSQVQISRLEAKILDKIRSSF
ncbi:MAG: SigB/SigF/SigG family RNA polymerase sigma factor [Christensenellales bacterium]|jgi:RNA polymerase sporulation-specific sigma factor|nr:SigB/SigF/SigG family RNA polymerase sigma factor [Clostridia bacterium]HRU84449.1 SigB/SigF/SigG family RNA polymerase sigma factor [Eubacteriales bacterium]